MRWTELQFNKQVVFGVALRVEGGLLLGLGRGVAGTGTRQVVRQFVTCALQFIMQLVTVELWASRIFSCALAPCASAALISDNPNECNAPHAPSAARIFMNDRTSKT